MPSQYLDLDARTMWERSAHDLCAYCGESDHGDCKVRYCDSCSQRWLSDTPKMIDAEGPACEYCPECKEAEANGETVIELRLRESIDLVRKAKGGVIA